jgi:hypothetical protein
LLIGQRGFPTAPLRRQQFFNDVSRWLATLDDDASCFGAL